MSNEFTTAIMSIATAVIGVAIIAVIISKKSATVDVIKAAGDLFVNSIKAAIPFK